MRNPMQVITAIHMSAFCLPSIEGQWRGDWLARRQESKMVVLLLLMLAEADLSMRVMHPLPRADRNMSF